jgi:hypothetical protein
MAYTLRMRLGDWGGDLPENDTDTEDLAPWVQLEDTLTFVSAGCEWKRHCENLIVEPPVAVAY